MGKQRDLADSADVINFIDGLTSDVQSQLDTLDPLPSQTGESGKFLTTNGSVPSWAELSTNPTLGTLTKTFANNESSTISLTGSVLAPVVTVTKEVPQTGVTNNNWDVNSTTENYTRLNSAYATSLSWTGFDVSEATYSQSQNISAQDGSPYGIAFNTDGTKMFMVGVAGDDVNEYTLSTAYDITTASFVDSFSVTSQDGQPRQVVFNTDGTKMFIAGGSTGAVYEYTLSTSFDVSTSSYIDSFSVSTQEATPQGLAFNADGTKMFVTGWSSDSVHEYTLSTGFDISSASFVDSFSISAQENAPRSMAFNTDGTKMFVVGNTGDNVNEYTLSTGFDISTASFVDSFSVASQSTDPSGLAFSSTGAKMFVVDSTSANIYEYNIPEVLVLGTGSFASSDVGKTIVANSGEFILKATDGSYAEITAPTSYDQVASGDWEMYGVVYNTADGDLELSFATVDKYDVSTATYVDALIVTSQDSNPREIAFSTDGTKMFLIGITTDSVHEYNLSTAFDIFSSSFVQSFSVSGQETSPSGLAFSTDGTKMFIVGIGSDSVVEYGLSTAFDISTASYATAFSINALDTGPWSLTFNTDGTKMFVVGSTNDNVLEYALSTGFSISTAVYSQSFSVSAQDTLTAGLAFNSDGTKMFIVGRTGDNVYEYTLETSFDVSTASYSQSFSLASESTQPSGICFNDDGSKMFITSYSGDDVIEYSLGTKLTPTGYHPVHTTTSIDSTYWTDINSMTADQAAGSGNVYYAISTDDRTTWTVIDNTDGERDIVRNNGGTWQYNSNGTYASETWTNGTTNTELATLAEAMEGASVATNAFDVSTASYSGNSFSVSSQESFPQGMCFNNDGTKMYIVGSDGDDINEYTLSTAFDVSTLTYSQNFSVAGQDTYPTDIAFNTDGTKMYFLGFTGQDVNEYTLSTGFDISTASYSQNFSVSSQEADPQGLAFNSDGTKMFIVGFTGDDVNEYTLSTGFDISTASFVDSFSVAGQETQPRGVSFNTDGTQMYVVGTSNDTVYEYTLSTGFDVSTASYSQSFSVTAQQAAPYKAIFNNDGNKMYVIGTFPIVGVSEYNIGTTTYTNQMDKTQLDAVTDPNHIALGNDLDLAIIFNMTSGTTVPSSDGVSINYDANVLNKGAVLGTDYDFDAPAQDKVRITALAGNNLKVRIV